MVDLTAVKDRWRRLVMRQAHYADSWRRLDLLYLIRDPWGMGSAAEQARFEWTGGLIATHLSPVETILEVGCGEGHQSVHLARMCRQLYAIDISPRAIRRARKNCASARFASGDPFDFGFDPPAPLVFDLVTACEVLYYIKDPAAVLRRLSEIGRACLVTYHQSEAARLEPFFAGVGQSETARLRFEDHGWIARWWRR